MKILLSGISPNYGGIESFVINYCREIKKHNPSFIVDIIGYTDEPAYKDAFLKMGGRVYQMPSPKSLDFKNKTRDFFALHSNEYSAFWCNKCDLHDIAFLRASRGIPKRILHAHSSNISNEGARSLIYYILHNSNKQLVENYCTDYWACSDWAAEWIFTKHVLSNLGVKYIPNAIQLSQFAFDNDARRQIRNDFGLTGTVFGSVGRLSRTKNPLFALKTFECIRSKNPNSWLLFVGEGELEETVRRQTHQMSGGDHVLFLGFRQDVSQLLQAMDCLLMPSLFEGFPVASIEAQAAGLPVFAASDGITPQAQLTDLFHFLPLSLGPEGWAEKILKTDLTRKDRQDTLREKGFDISLAARQLLDELEQ